MTASEIELCTNSEHVITKVYNFLLKCDTEEAVKECIIKWVKNQLRYAGGTVEK